MRGVHNDLTFIMISIVLQTLAFEVLLTFDYFSYSRHFVV